MRQEDQQPKRRTVLRNGAAVAGALVVGGAATGTAAGRVTRADAAQANSQRRGGRGQVDGEVRRHKPFTLVVNGTDVRPASCQSDQSATQTYVTYEIYYCDEDNGNGNGDEDDDDPDAVLYSMPDEAELVDTEVYAFRSVRPCRHSELDQVAFGPINEEC